MKGQRVDGGVYMNILGYRGEDVYDGSLGEFYVCECEDVFLYVYLYKDVDVFEGH